MINNKTNQEAPQVGRYFEVKTENGIVEMLCVKWTDEHRVFECSEGCIDLDWMEYADQSMLGRIKEVA